MFFTFFKSMMCLYWNSKFITRYYKDNAKEILKRHQEYCKWSPPLLFSDCTIVDDSEVPDIKAKIVLFNEFKYTPQLRKLMERMPYPKGLQVVINQSKQSMKCKKHLCIYETNIKLFFEKENSNSANFSNHFVALLCSNNCENLSIGIRYIDDGIIVLKVLDSSKSDKGLHLLKPQNELSLDENIAQLRIMLEFYK